MKARVYVTLKKGVHDPQGEAVLGTLQHLKFKGVQEVRVGKYIEVFLNATSREEANKEVETMCEKLLVNPIIESYSFELTAES